MHGITMFLQQMQLPQKSAEQMKSLEDREMRTLFQSLLTGNLTAGMPEQEHRLMDEENKEGNIPFSKPLSLFVNQVTTDEMTQMSVPEWMDITSIMQEKEEHADLPYDGFTIVEFKGEMEQSELPVHSQTLIDIFREIQTVLGSLTSEQETSKQAATKILQLLQKWVNTANHPSGRKGMEKALVSFNKGETKEHKIWQDVLQTFEKRHQLASSHQYSANAHVTSEDIAKWLDRAMERLQTTETTFHRMPTASALPISRMEQYVVYLNEDQSARVQGQQLTAQFQSIMKSSNFMLSPNAGNQLMISLRPENLGEMMIRFTQVNGEMTVKILVTTQAAKEMLESNINQLRNMFSPQQVVIEKQDNWMQQAGETEKRTKDEQTDEQKEQESNNNSKEENQQSNDEFAAQFEALLMNEEA